ncbi:hypothetical protein F0358_13135 [Empedobacter brevis]|uniref:hypothetical protein n=1 Tax=Empedobacter brevis TaxID=247 RepID=UPI00123D82AD|nr:hypothetical protein [Empedobacter brevis]QES93597.1 hypothetical protein F0358_13135 [Empedobacter brevis]
MNIANKYSKTIISKYDLIPVYLPGTDVQPGHIIDFGSSIFGANKPIGSFSIYDHLSGYHGIDINVVESKTKQTFNLVSSKEVTVSPTISGQFPGVADGDIKFDFASQGSFILFGINGVESRIDNLFSLRDKLRDIADKEDWSKYYIVTSVTICKKALIYAAQEKGGTLIISANTKDMGILGDQLTGVSADISIDVKWKNKAAFSTDWEDDIAVLMKLARFKKGEIKVYDKMIDLKAGKSSGNNAANEIGLENIDPQSLLKDIEA